MVLFCYLLILSHPLPFPTSRFPLFQLHLPHSSSSSYPPNSTQFLPTLPDRTTSLLVHPYSHPSLLPQVSSLGGVPAWVLMDAADVDLEYHVVEEGAADVDSSQCHVGGEEGGKGGKGGEEERGAGGEGEGALESHVVRLQSLPPFDPNRPLWQVHLIHLPSGSRPCEPLQPHSAAVFRIHHALGDGISLM
ncbi:unnamed protein product [Closterium sp. Naga37s-1]|nr:unnamed protein product [Closterium sp. Naga37s-1]